MKNMERRKFGPMGLFFAVTICLAHAGFGIERPGGVAGRVIDVRTGQPIQAADVTIVNIDEDISTTTGPNGRYTLANVPAGKHTMRVTKLGYIAKQLEAGAPAQPGGVKRLITYIPDQSDKSNITVYPEHQPRVLAAEVALDVKPESVATLDVGLDAMPNLDWARCAVVEASSNLRDRYAINDGISTTGWRPEPGRVRGEWIELSWDTPISIAVILVHSSGPLRDYTVQYSTNSKDWTDLRRVISSESGHTHWLEKFDLPTPIIVKDLRVLINSTRESEMGTIWSIEAYKTKGSLTGYVKDTTGSGFQGAQVHVYEAVDGVRGPSRLDISTTTRPDGSYSVPVPEGKVMVSSWASDSLAVTSGPVDVAASRATSVPDLIIADRVRESFVPLFDDFHFVPSPRWSPQSGKWWIVDGKYRADSTFTDGLYSMIGDLIVRDSVVEVDALGSDSSLVFRYQVGGKTLVMLVWCSWPDYKGGDVTPLGWHDYEGQWWFYGLTDVVVDRNREKGVHLRGVVIGNKAQGFISDGQVTYWTPIVSIDHVAGPGMVGLYKENGYMKAGPLEDPEFDNFSTHGSMPTP